MRSPHFRFAFSFFWVQNFIHSPRYGPSEAMRGKGVVGDQMLFRDLLNNDQLLLVVCHDCHAHTPVDPTQHALKLGVDADVAAIKPEATCPACGSADISLGAFSPLEQRKVIEVA